MAGPDQDEVERARQSLSAARDNTPSHCDRRLAAHAVILDEHANRLVGRERDMTAALRDICHKLTWL